MEKDLEQLKRERWKRLEEKLVEGLEDMFSLCASKSVSVSVRMSVNLNFSVHVILSAFVSVSRSACVSARLHGIICMI